MLEGGAGGFGDKNGVGFFFLGFAAMKGGKKGEGRLEAFSGEAVGEGVGGELSSGKFGVGFAVGDDVVVVCQGDDGTSSIEEYLILSKGSFGGKELLGKRGFKESFFGGKSFDPFDEDPCLRKGLGEVEEGVEEVLPLFLAGQKASPISVGKGNLGKDFF